MKIEELNKKRNALTHGMFYEPEYRSGWDAAIETLLPEIDRLEIFESEFRRKCEQCNGLYKRTFELESQNKKLVEALKTMAEFGNNYAAGILKELVLK